MAKSNLPGKFLLNPSLTFSVILLTIFYALSRNGEKFVNAVLDPDAKILHTQRWAKSNLL